VLAVIVTITARSKCTDYSYCENNGEGIYAMLAIIVTIMTITGGLYVVLAVIVTKMAIKGRYIYSANNYGENITGRYICNASNYCDNNDNNVEVHM